MPHTPPDSQMTAVEKEHRESFLKIFGFEPDPPDACETRVVNLEKVRAKVDELREAWRQADQAYENFIPNLIFRPIDQSAGNTLKALHNKDDFLAAKNFAWQEWYSAWALALMFDYYDKSFQES